MSGPVGASTPALGGDRRFTHRLVEFPGEPSPDEVKSGTNESGLSHSCGGRLGAGVRSAPGHRCSPARPMPSMPWTHRGDLRRAGPASIPALPYGPGAVERARPWVAASVRGRPELEGLPWRWWAVVARSRRCGGGGPRGVAGGCSSWWGEFHLFCASFRVERAVRACLRGGLCPCEPPSGPFVRSLKCMPALCVPVRQGQRSGSEAGFKDHLIISVIMWTAASCPAPVEVHYSARRPERVLHTEVFAPLTAALVFWVGIASPMRR